MESRQFLTNKLSGKRRFYITFFKMIWDKLAIATMTFVMKVSRDCRKNKSTCKLEYHQEIILILGRFIKGSVPWCDQIFYLFYFKRIPALPQKWFLLICNLFKTMLLRPRLNESNEFEKAASYISPVPWETHSHTFHVQSACLWKRTWLNVWSISAYIVTVFMLLFLIYRLTARHKAT